LKNENYSKNFGSETFNLCLHDLPRPTTGIFVNSRFQTKSSSYNCLGECGNSRVTITRAAGKKERRSEPISVRPKKEIKRKKGIFLGIN
jgi:hypothetical protein